MISQNARLTGLLQENDNMDSLESMIEKDPDI